MNDFFNIVTTHWEAILSVGIFVVFYILLIQEKIEKPVLAIFAAAACMMTGLLSFDQAVQEIDLNVIFLLVGMMTCVEIIAETGIFECLALLVAKKMKGRAWAILTTLLILTGILSAFLDNVTTIILLVPVTILITQILEIPTAPFLILEVMASNIGGTATLIGDPPNIIIGSQLKISFMDFIENLTPIAIICVFILILYGLFFLRGKINVPDNIRMRVMESCPERAIRDSRKMRNSLLIFGFILLGFFCHHIIHLQPGVIAFAGMGAMLLACRTESSDMLKMVAWDTIIFFIGLFVVVGAMKEHGVIDYLATGLKALCGTNQFLTVALILVGSSLLSAVLDNIPFVIAMTPLVQSLVEVDANGVADPSNPIIWALAIGACFGGNGTLIGASANIVAVKIGNKNNVKITFADFLKWGIPITGLTVLVSLGYLWFRYFFLKG